jgi:hypothetical protein
MSTRFALVSLLALAACETGERRQTVASSSVSTPDTPRRPYAVGSCAHDPCVAGAKLGKSCDSCVSQICAQDSYCCSNKWDQQCINEVGSVCGQTCGGGGGGGCAHDVCAVGGKLVASCSTCAGDVCAQDSYCCNTKWDSQCVGEVPSICGQTCGGVGGGPDMAVGPDMSTPGAPPPPPPGGGNLLHFAVFGDCRPPNLEGTNNYPSAIVGGIFSLAQSHAAQFMVGTGDYVFSNTSSGVSAQLKLFNQARANFSNPVYLTMGNHECNGYTASNCPNLNETPNVQQFMNLLPSGVTKPYYRLDFDTPFGKAKLVFIAANAWNSTQQSWLQQQMSDPTTYTFVMRHEPPADTQAPGVGPSESIVQSSSYTLELLGHTHEYKHIDTQHVISGNAGAPLQPSSGFGFGMLLIDQLGDGNIQVTEYDESSGTAVDTWRVTPSGASAP